MINRLNKRNLDFITFTGWQGRHFRLLNRLMSKNIKNEFKSIDNVLNHIEENYFEHKDSVRGVATALYSKLAGTTEKTLGINDGNLGLVVENDDVKVPIVDIQADPREPHRNLRYAGIHNSKILSSKRMQWNRKYLANVDLLSDAEISGTTEIFRNLKGGVGIKLLTGATLADSELSVLHRARGIEGELSVLESMPGGSGSVSVLYKASDISAHVNIMNDAKDFSGLVSIQRNAKRFNEEQLILNRAEFFDATINVQCNARYFTGNKEIQCYIRHFKGENHIQTDSQDFSNVNRIQEKALDIKSVNAIQNRSKKFSGNNYIEEKAIALEGFNKIQCDTSHFEPRVNYIQRFAKNISAKNIIQCSSHAFGSEDTFNAILHNAKDIRGNYIIQKNTHDIKGFTDILTASSEVCAEIDIHTHALVKTGKYRIGMGTQAIRGRIGYQAIINPSLYDLPPQHDITIHESVKYDI